MLIFICNLKKQGTISIGGINTLTITARRLMAVFGAEPTEGRGSPQISQVAG
jgi:hypothetical protein